MANLFADIPGDLPEELTTVLASGKSLRIERIVSQGHASPTDFWYDQPEQEWVLVVQGAARLVLATDEQADGNTAAGNQTVELTAGDWINIPAHRRHRVDWTTPDEPTIWLAVFYG